MKKSKKNAATATGVEAEILKVTSTKPRFSKEEDQDYRSRMARAVDDWCKSDKATAEVAEERFDSLSVPTQEWCNDASQAINDKNDIPEFPSAEGTSPPADTPEPNTGEKETPMKKSKKGSKGEAPESTDGAEAPKKSKKVKTPKEPKVKKPRGGKHLIFRKTIVSAYLKGGDKLKFTPIYDAYAEKVGIDAITRPSASVVYSNTVQTLNILDELQALKR